MAGWVDIPTQAVIKLCGSDSKLSAGGPSGQLTLSDDSTLWYIDPLPRSEDEYTLRASSVGFLQVIATAVAQPPEGGAQEGNVTADTKAFTVFGWRILSSDSSKGAFEITVADPSFPGQYPNSGELYLAAGADGLVGWKWSGGIVKQVPDKALWCLVPQ